MNTQQKDLFIIRGLPGSGKSAFIKAIAPDEPNVYNTDSFMTDVTGAYQWSPERHRAAIDKVNEEITAAIERGEPRIFLDGVFDEVGHFEKFVTLAKGNGYRVFSIVVENRHGSVSSHNVPPETMERFRTNFDIQL